LVIEPAAAGAQGPSPVDTAYVREVRAFIPGNQVVLLRDGAQAYPAMLAAIDGAQRFVHLETFIFADDATGGRFAKSLVAAAIRGVEVTVLYDAVGSWRTHRSFLRGLRRHGVTVRAFSPFFPWRGSSSLLRRDHRKLLVVDAQVAFVGGINISDAWAPERLGGMHWRDDVLRIEGPAVAPLDGVFRATWRTAMRGLAQTLAGGRPEARTPPAAEAKGSSSVAIFASRRAIHHAYLYAIQRATRSVVIASGYFVPDGAMLRALREARRRGVEVTLILPAKSDHFSVVWAGRALYGRLLRWGVRLFEWPESVFHCKTAVIDGVWGTVGSFNLDRWSLSWSYELNAVFSDPRLGGLLHDAMAQDLRVCQPIALEAWKARSRWSRLAEWFFGMFARWM
jgi:cardiolipin synthase